MARAIEAVASHQPGSRVYQAMTAVAYYAGLRPSEVVMLRVRSVTLPAKGWGRIDVTEADISWDEPGEPKTGPRRVPIPPLLVDVLRRWIEEAGLTSSDELLFRTPRGTRPSTSNWGRAWHRALASIGQPPMRVYDCRHAAATTWLRAGVPLGETARRLGHSVETLVSTYVGALEGDEALGNQRIEAELARATKLARQGPNAEGDRPSMRHHAEVTTTTSILERPVYGVSRPQACSACGRIGRVRGSTATSASGVRYRR